MVLKTKEKKFGEAKKGGVHLYGHSHVGTVSKSLQDQPIRGTHKRVKRAEQVVDQVRFENLTSFQNMFEFSLFSTLADLKRILIKPNTS